MFKVDNIFGYNHCVLINNNVFLVFGVCLDLPRSRFCDNSDVIKDWAKAAFVVNIAVLMIVFRRMKYLLRRRCLARQKLLRSQRVPEQLSRAGSLHTTSVATQMTRLYISINCLQFCLFPFYVMRRVYYRVRVLSVDGVIG